MSRRARKRREAKAAEAGIEIFTDQDAKVFSTLMLKIAQGAGRSSEAEIERAKEKITQLTEKKKRADEQQADSKLDENMRVYYAIKPRDPDWLRRRVLVEKYDDIYGYLQPLPQWLMQGAALFTDYQNWMRVAQPVEGDRGYGYGRGRITISGFRRPEALLCFRSATVMSALLRHTHLFDIWSQLGIDFEPSPLVKVAEPTTPLGQRRLRIYWLTSQGWSKRLRDRSGGIAEIFQLIIRSDVLTPAEEVCICTNKDDASEDDPRAVTEHFRNAVMMPHNSRGQNRFRIYHQLVHTAALNSYTSDIRFIEQTLGIDSHQQRIARCGQEVYQTLMRLSIREPKASHDITLVVMDKDVAEWLVQWFEPTAQVSVSQIEGADDVVHQKQKHGRPTLGERPMTAAERKARSRAHHRALL